MRPTLYYLFLERLKDNSHHRCKLLATSLDEAMRVARTSYGPVKLLSSGTRDLALGHLCLGQGRFISTRYDRLIEPAVIGSLRN